MPSRPPVRAAFATADKASANRDLCGRALALAFGLLLLVGCEPEDPGGRRPLPSPETSGRSQVETLDPEAIYGAAATRFETAHFFKPDRAFEGNVEFDLAPLLIQEAHAKIASGVRPGRFRAPGTPESPVADRPTLYFQEGEAILHGKHYRQIAYLWWYPPDAPSGTGGSSGGTLQGVRLTLWEDGRAMLWEALPGPSGPYLIYVARPLEEAAASRHGRPLAGRRFAIERSREACPNVLVPRAIEPGPTPMGPFVYLEDPPSRIRTVICRCMPAQLDGIAENGYYQLEPLSELRALGLEKQEWTVDPPRPLGTAPPSSQAHEAVDWLERCLRLES